MVHIIVGVFLILHGAVHLWYVAMARGLVPADADTIWNGKSWLLTRTLGDQVTMTLATIVHSVTTVVFVVAGIGMVAQQEWFASWAIAGAILSFACLVGFWDGRPDHHFQWPSI